jgi:hypothetical protein
MKTVTSPHDATLRFWMVRIPDTVLSADRREANHKIKAAGFDMYRASGIKARIAAVNLAQRIEKATGIEMEICKHDYL